MRLFVCFDLPASVREEVSAFIANCKKAEPRAKWARAGSIHITLKFLGETREDQVAEIRRALETVRSSTPVDIHYRGLGFFPDKKHPRVFWAGVEASKNLPEIAHGINRAVEPVGFPAEDREFVPHLTLARIPAPGRCDKLTQIATEFSSHEFGTSRETEFHLIQSFLKPAGAEYKRLASFAFVKEPA